MYLKAWNFLLKSLRITADLIPLLYECDGCIAFSFMHRLAHAYVPLLTIAASDTRLNCRNESWLCWRELVGYIEACSLSQPKALTVIEWDSVFVVPFLPCLRLDHHWEPWGYHNLACLLHLCLPSFLSQHITLSLVANENMNTTILQIQQALKFMFITLQDFYQIPVALGR